MLGGIWHDSYEYFTIDVVHMRKWKEMPMLPGKTLPKESTLENGKIGGQHGRNVKVKVNWSTFYGELKKGKYRLVKWIGTGKNKSYLYAPFIIN